MDVLDYSCTRTNQIVQIKVLIESKLNKNYNHRKCHEIIIINTGLQENFQPKNQLKNIFNMQQYLQYMTIISLKSNFVVLNMRKT